jgi:hypothetical protein
MADEMTGTETSVAAPAAPAQGTPQTPAAPEGAAANADGAGSQGTEGASQVQAKVEQTPMGALAAAAEGQQQQQQAQLLAGKFKTPQDLEKGYLEAQKLISRTTQKQKEMEEQLQQIQAATQGRQQQQEQGQEDPFIEQWKQHPEFGPLAQMPDPRFNPDGHREWVEKVFAPRFMSDPSGTMRYLIAPEIRAGLVQMRESIMEEFQTRDTTQKLTGFFDSKPEYLAGKSVNEMFLAWGEDGVKEYGQLLKAGVPVEAAVEMLALRRGQKPLQAAATAAQAKEQDLRTLASGAANRGTTSTADKSLVGKGESFGEMMADSLARAGAPLERTPVMSRNPFGGKKK